MDYVKDLSEEDKEWLNQFIGEYYAADMDFDNLENNFHSTEKLKKDCTDRNNARNRCLYTIAKAQNKVLDVNPPDTDESVVKIRSNLDVEDSLIDVIDEKTRGES